MSEQGTSLVVTIDTEPDSQWQMADPGKPLPEPTFSNTRNLGRLIDFFRRMKLRATWMTTFSVARDKVSVRWLAAAAGQGDEIACHLHAWETPPLTGDDSFVRSYIYEYDAATRLAKLETITETIFATFGVRPRSHRAGRWGIDRQELRHLEKLGYTVDSSVVPGFDFRKSIGKAQGGPDFRRLLIQASPVPYRCGNIWEAPVSVTAAGGRIGDRLSVLLARNLATRRDIATRILNKLLVKAGISRFVWLRPLAHPRSELVRAALAMAASGTPIINIMFHSSEMFAGTSPYTKTEADVQKIYGDLEAMVTALLAAKRVVSRTLSEAIDL